MTASVVFTPIHEPPNALLYGYWLEEQTAFRVLRVVTVVGMARDTLLYEFYCDTPPPIPDDEVEYKGHPIRFRQG